MKLYYYKNPDEPFIYDITEGESIAESILKIFPNGLGSKAVVKNAAGYPLTYEYLASEEAVVDGDLFVFDYPAGGVGDAFLSVVTAPARLISAGIDFIFGSDPIAVNYDIAAENPELRGLTSNSSNSFTGQRNVARLGERLPVAYGTNRIYPDLLQNPLIEYLATDGTIGVQEISGITVFANSRKEVVQEFMISDTWGEAVEDTIRFGDNSGTSEVDFEVNGSGTDVVSKCAFNVDISGGKLIPFDYLIYKRAALYRRSSTQGSDTPGTNYAVMAITIGINGEGYISITPGQTGAANDDDCQFFGYQMALLNSGDEFEIANMEAGQPSGQYIEGTYEFKNLAIGDNGGLFEDLRVNFQKIDGNNPPSVINGELIQAGNVLEGPYLESEFVRGDLHDGSDLVDRFPFYELPQRYGTHDTFTVQNYVNISFNFAGGLDSEGVGDPNDPEPNIGVFIRVYEWRWNPTLEQWDLNIGGANNQKRYLYNGWQREGDGNLSGMIQHELSDNLDTAERIAISFHRTKIADRDGSIGYVTPYSFPVTGLDGITVVPADLTPWSVTGTNVKYVSDATLIRIQQVIERKFVRDFAWIRSTFTEAIYTNPVPTDQLNLVFKSWIRKFNPNTGSFEGTQFTDDYRDIIMFHLVYKNDIPLEYIDYEALYAAETPDDFTSLNLILSNKANDLAQELNTMASPFFTHVIQSGQTYTFGYEYSDTSKPLTSVITGRIGFLNSMKKTHRFVAADNYNAIKVQFNDSADNTYKLRTFKIYPNNIPTSELNFKNIKLDGIKDATYVEAYARVLFNKMVLQRKSTMVKTNSSMASALPFDRVKLTDPANFSTQTTINGTVGSYNGSTIASQECELIALDNGTNPPTYTASEILVFPDSGSGYAAGIMEASITDEYGDIITSDFYVYPADGEPYETKKIKIERVGAGFTNQLHYRNQLISSTEGYSQIGARLNLTPIFQGTQDSEASKLDDYLIVSVDPSSNHEVQLKLIEYSDLFYRTDALDSIITTELD